MRLEDLELKGKKVFIRVDYNVALSENKEVLDDTRIKKGLQSIKFCSEKGAKVAIATHLGYPGGKVVEELSTFKLKEYIEKNLNKQISFVNVCTGVTMKEAVEKLHDGEIILLENLRFYEGELSDDKSFGEELVKEFDVYINDGFSVSHRKHASVSVAKNFIKNKALGLSLTSEVTKLNSLTKNTVSSVAVIGGGWKAVEKIAVVENLAKTNDAVLVGGALAQIFFIAKNIPLKPSIEIARDKIEVAAKVLEAHDNIILPEDNLVLTNGEVKQVNTEELTEDMQVFDIGPNTIKRFKEVISGVKRVFWNGPLGKFEDERFETATREIAQFIAGLNSESIVYGGETLSAVNKFNLNDKYSFVSTAGGAGLSLLAGKRMPGLEIE